MRCLHDNGKTKMRIEFKENNLLLEDDFSITKLSDKADRLFKSQINNWELASAGYKSLSSVQINKFEFDNFEVEAHFNPGRIISSSAKVDSKSIGERPCFLCVKNLPLEQKAVKANGNYIILVNPFPIFPKHFTIPSINHVPQLIYDEFENMLLLSKNMGKKFTLFYNGPKCGASAPDHMHFQAGNKGFMKIDDEYDKIVEVYGKIVYEKNDLRIFSVTGYLRNFISMESNKLKSLVSSFKIIYKLLSENGEVDEPMMNIICGYENNWRVIIFPRIKHRPSYFFEEGKDKILISPAAVDLGGVCIFPREEDFERVNKDLIVDIYKQVTINDEKIRYIANEFIDIIGS